MQSKDSSEDMLDQLILEGLVEVAAIDSGTGEMLYSFTEKAREELPEVQRQAEELFNSMIMFFWEHGFLSMNIDEANPVIRVTPKALDDDEVEKLSAEHRQALAIILEALKIQ